VLPPIRAIRSLATDGCASVHFTAAAVSSTKPRFLGLTSTAAGRLDCCDVDLLHLHHRIERALGGSGIGIGDRFRQGDRRNLPGQSPFVLAPAARALLAAVAHDRVPVPIRFRLVRRCDLKREGPVILPWPSSSSLCASRGAYVILRKPPALVLVKQPRQSE